MDMLVEPSASALASGINPISAVRAATGYTLEQIAISSGLALADLTAIEADASVDNGTLTRILTALGLPESVIE